MLRMLRVSRRHIIDIGLLEGGRMPQSRFPLSRGFANGGRVLGAALPMAALADSFAMGYYRSPLTGLSVCGIRRQIGIPLAVASLVSHEGGLLRPGAGRIREFPNKMNFLSHFPRSFPVSAPIHLKM